MKMRLRKCSVLLLALLTAFTMLGLTGCQGNEGGVGAAVNKIDTTGVEPLAEVTNLSGDCVITDKQMATIAGADGEYRFTGVTDEGITYTWIYEADHIQNPQEQHLKVTINNEQTKEVQKAANNASVGLGITLESMNMAAPATLELKLTEKWNADSVVYCKYQDGQVQRISDAKITKEGKGKKAVTVLTFAVPVAGSTYYLVGGSSKASQSAETQKGAQAEENGETVSGNEEQTQSGEDENSGDVVSSDPNGGQVSDNSNGGSGSSAGSANGNSGSAGNASANNGSSDKSGGNAGAGSGSSDKSGGNAGGNTASSGNSGEDENSADQGNAGNAQDDVLTCTFSIECTKILENWDDLDPSKAEFVPEDGWILLPSEVEFTEGETVFDVLKRVCKEANIHMASKYTPIYGSYYVEGINQLYEFDCGSRSGWMYSVNGWYPNYGNSQYKLKDGDVVEWRYTCELGTDIGGGFE